MKLEEVHDLLHIDKDAIDDELIKHPQLYYNVALSAVQSRNAALIAKNDRDRVMAEADLDIRAEAESAGTKLTEGKIKAIIETDEEVIARATAYQTALGAAAEWDAARDAFATRGPLVRDLVSLMVSDLINTNGTSVRPQHDSMVNEAEEKKEEPAPTGRRRRAKPAVEEPVAEEKKEEPAPTGRRRRAKRAEEPVAEEPVAEEPRKRRALRGRMARK